MSTDFQRLMSRAAEQTRGGDLAGATATIQAAFGGAAGPRTAAPADHADVIDVEARVVGEGGQEADVRVDGAAATDAERFLVGTFAAGRASIDYRLYIPPGDGAVPRPLLLMLHGCTQNPEDFAAGTRMNELARQHGWLVLYPAQTQKANAQRCWNWFKHNHQQRGRGEPALLNELVRSVMQTHRVDPNRVHVAGLSAGGAMAAILGQAYPDLFASVGVHSGLPCGVATDVTGALALMRDGQGMPAARQSASGDAPVVPTIVFHGTRDITVHPLNGERVFAAALQGRDGARHAEQGRAGGRSYTRTIHTTAEGRTLAELWLIDGAGHAWSGGSPRGSYADAQGPDAAEQMLRFFTEHPLAS